MKQMKGKVDAHHYNRCIAFIKMSCSSILLGCGFNLSNSMNNSESKKTKWGAVQERQFCTDIWVHSYRPNCSWDHHQSALSRNWEDEKVNQETYKI